MRSEQTLHGNRKLNTRTGICRKQLLTNGHVEHPPENSELLVYRRGFDRSQLLVTELGFDDDRRAKTFAKVNVNGVRSDVHQSNFP